MHSAIEPTWLFFDVAAKGLALIAVAFACSLLLRKASAAWRHLLWSLTGTGLLILPLLTQDKAVCLKAPILKFDEVAAALDAGDSILQCR